MKQEWRCSRCGKLLGRRTGRKFHIRSSSSHEYLTPFPVSAICKWCRTRHEIKGADPQGPSPRTGSGISG
jgi:hypothetical protein